jgi:hypothetical protein
MAEGGAYIQYSTAKQRNRKDKYGEEKQGKADPVPVPGSLIESLTGIGKSVTDDGDVEPVWDDSVPNRNARSECEETKNRPDEADASEERLERCQNQRGRLIDARNGSGFGSAGKLVRP